MKKNAFYTSLLSDWSNFENWQDAGSKTTVIRANGIWKSLLRDYQAPPLDEAIAEELNAYVARRKTEIEAGIDVPA